MYYFFIVLFYFR